MNHAAWIVQHLVGSGTRVGLVLFGSDLAIVARILFLDYFSIYFVVVDNLGPRKSRPKSLRQNVHGHNMVYDKWPTIRVSARVGLGLRYRS